MPRKIHAIREETIVDYQTGEAISKREEQAFFLDGEPPFVKLYLDNVLFLQDLPKHLNGVMMALLNRMPYGGKGFAINGFIRKQIAEELGMSEGSVRNAITRLTQGTVLIRLGTGTYQFSPDFFGRGEWRDIEELRLNITYNRRGRTFAATVKHADKLKSAQAEGQLMLTDGGEIEEV